MINFRKSIFWILLFLLLIFCCWFYVSAKTENQKKIYSQPVAQTKTATTTAVKTTKTIAAAEEVATGTQSTIMQTTTSQLFPVSRVIDGDTIVVSMNGQNETVRLLGMDTPETVDPRKPVQCFGVEASDETRSLLDGRSVSLQSDPTQSDRDKYGRLLRYVFRDDGLFVDEYLVKEGFAYEYTYFDVPYEYQTEFRADQTAARLAGVGLWATSTCDGKE